VHATVSRAVDFCVDLGTRHEASCLSRRLEPSWAVLVPVFPVTREFFSFRSYLAVQLFASETPSRACPSLKQLHLGLVGIKKLALCISLACRQAMRDFVK
jgi:hypothetical protein